MRLVDADAVSKLFDAEFGETLNLIYAGETHLDNLAEGFCEAYRVIQNMPTIDAVPVVHGRWEYSAQTIHTQSLMRCSICGWWTLDPSVDGAYHYCPHCGAKMNSEEEHD